MDATNYLGKAKGLRAVVTAGSTLGVVDAVRIVEQSGYDFPAGTPLEHLERFEMQNPFRGALGLRIAEALHRLGIQVTLLTRLDLLAGMKHELPASCIEGFRTFQDLENALPEVLARNQPHLVWQAAAVSDWIPVEVEGVRADARKGKIDSSTDTLRVIFKQTPKLLDRIRGYTNPQTTIVGFKLLVDVPESTIAARAKSQIARAESDFCVGNDFKLITKTVHPVFLYDKLGQMVHFAGAKDQVANWLVDTIVTEHVKRTVSNA